VERPNPHPYPAMSHATAPRPEASPAAHASRVWPRLAANPWLFVLPVTLYLLALSIYPLVSSFALSLHEYHVDSRSFSWVGFGNYAAVFQNPEFFLAFRNTVIFTVAAVAAELALGMALALFMTRRMIGKNVLRTVLIIPMMTTPMVVGLMWRFLFNTDFGIVDYGLRVLFRIPPVNWLGAAPYSLISLIIVDIWQWTPFAFLILYAALATIPEELLEAARVDGARGLQVFLHITLPLLIPVINIVVLFRGMDSFRAFDTVYTLTFGGPGRESATLSFLAYLEGFSYSHLGLASAMSYVMVAMILIGVTVYRFTVMPRSMR
jgi:multiple sugar transport system permease protein